ncbi:MAG: type II secretion system F family protein [Rhizobiaceae bacterium]
MFGFDVNTIAFVALAGFSVAALLYSLLYGKIESEARTDQRLKSIKTADTDRSTVRTARDLANDANKRRKQVQDSLKDLESRQKDRDRMIQRPPLKIQLQQAGLSVPIERFMLYSIVAGVALAFAVFILTGATLTFQSLAMAIGAGIAGGFGLPRWVVSYMRKKRILKFLDEFPNAIDIIVRAVKSGLPLNDGLRLIANEAKEPVRSEFRRMIDAQSLGISVPEAALKLYENMPCSEANFFGIVIQIQSQAGGNLSEALGNLSRVIRDRKKMKAKVAALSMEAKASAAIIAALPFIVTVLVYLSSPEYILVLFTTSTGHMLIGVSLSWMMIGVMVMKKMINFDM